VLLAELFLLQLEQPCPGRPKTSSQARRAPRRERLAWRSDRRSNGLSTASWLTLPRPRCKHRFAARHSQSDRV